jgi:predicted O-linked N-acetylglucosamine transferase (SPINDLY family)
MTGRTPHSRAGLTILSQLGHPECVTTTIPDYVQAARTLAENEPVRTHLRQSLRTQLQQSPLTNAPAFAKDVESAYREVWRSLVRDNPRIKSQRRKT